MSYTEKGHASSCGVHFRTDGRCTCAVGEVEQVNETARRAAELAGRLREERDDARRQAEALRAQAERERQHVEEIERLRAMFDTTRHRLLDRANLPPATSWHALETHLVETRDEVERLRATVPCAWCGGSKTNPSGTTPCAYCYGTGVARTPSDVRPEWLAEHNAKVRRAALEEAVRICEEQRWGSGLNILIAIRALAAKDAP